MDGNGRGLYCIQSYGQTQFTKNNLLPLFHFLTSFSKIFSFSNSQ